MFAFWSLFVAPLQNIRALVTETFLIFLLTNKEILWIHSNSNNIDASTEIRISSKKGKKLKLVLLKIIYKKYNILKNVDFHFT